MAPLKGKGNQWTTVGHFKFFAGKKGSVISRRMSQTPDGKLWMADAFRFTKVSEGCREIPEVGHMSLHITGKELDGHLPKVLETGLTSYPDMRMALREAVAEATKLPYELVNLLSLRRGSVIADIEIRGTSSAIQNAMAVIHGQTAAGSESTLKQSLCGAVITNGKGDCDVSVMQAKVLPAIGGTEEEAYTKETDSTMLVVGVITGVAAALMALTMCVLAYRFSAKKKENEVSEVATIHVAPKQAEDSSQDIYTDAEKGKPALDEVSLSGSTATPTSDRDGPDDINSELQSVRQVSNAEPQELACPSQDCNPEEELQISEV